MKALVKTAKGEGHVELLNIEQPSIAGDEVLLRIDAAGICGTDLHIYHDKAYYVPPVTLGHEYAGTVVEVGPRVESVKEGDRVTSPATIPCGECHLCRIGSPNRCIGHKRILGAVGSDGAFASYMKVPARILHKIPKGISAEEAATIEPAACAVHAVAERMKVDVGDCVVVLGPGPMGLLALQVAKAEGASPVIVAGVESDVQRLRTAEQLGADVIVNVEAENLRQTVEKHTQGLGADVVIEASGAAAAQRDCFDLARRRGRVCLLGLSGTSVNVTLDKVIEGELDIVGSWGTLWTSWRKALNLLSSGRVKVAPLIGSRLRLEEWEKGFKLMEDRVALKVLLMPS
ncbi:MAG: zinc-binding dehydrogenase [Candidatus Bathyarchaeia archaeon]